MKERFENNHLGIPLSTRVFCPKCGEQLMPVDIESYADCPYCGHGFVTDPKFEDFILLPFIQHWAHQTCNHFPGEPRKP